ncbi:MAG: pantetheine-phosphate adenylyltransferase [archaeon]
MRNQNKKYGIVAVGGTFDVFHSGHKALLREAFSAGKMVLIGLVTDSFAKHMAKSHPIASYQARLRVVSDFLEAEDVASRAQVVPLDDAYGIAASDLSIDALVVSSETLRTGEKINEVRASNGLPPLALVRVELVNAQNGKPISTTRIRAGQITRSGRTRKIGV